MNQTQYWYIFVEFSVFNAVFCAKSILIPDNENKIEYIRNAKDDDVFQLDSEHVLKRDKRYLLFTNGGISKVIRITLKNRSPFN